MPDGRKGTEETQAALGQNGIQADRRLAGLPVTNKKLPLPAANRNERVDGKDAGGERLGDAFPSDDAGRCCLDQPPHTGIPSGAVSKNAATARAGEGAKEPGAGADSQKGLSAGGKRAKDAAKACGQDHQRGSAEPEELITQHLDDHRGSAIHQQHFSYAGLL